MNKPSAILIAGFIGGLLGGLIIWVALSPSRSLTIYIDEPATQQPGVPRRFSTPGASPARGSSTDQVRRTTARTATPLSATPIPPVADVATREESSEPTRGSVETLQHVSLPTAPSAPPQPPTFPPHRPLIIDQSGPKSIDDALSFALEAADPYVKEGFTMREDYWGGTLLVKQPKAIVHQLFKGNDYWFWMGTAEARAKISLHVYDSDGNLAEIESKALSLKGGHASAARVVPKKTGSYYLIVEIEKSPEERTHWALAYGFR